MAEAILFGQENEGISPSGTEASFLAKDELKIGDIVYTIKGDINDELHLTPVNGYVHTAVFSPDGTKLVLGGAFTGFAKIYSVSGTVVTFVSNIYADAGNTALSITAFTAVFSPDGTKLVLGGQFSGRAKIYSVSGTTVTFVSNIYADTGTTLLSSTVNTATFSPDGTTLVLGGQFSGPAKIYSVSGTTVTFVSNIYADGGTTALTGYVHTAVFSPDGTRLVLGGTFTGIAKVYSVSVTTVTFLSNIYADTGTTALSNTTYTAVFSSDGTALVLGGKFTGYAKVYSVSGTVVTFVSNIYADAGTTALSGMVKTVSLSPDGNTLILSGDFVGKAKVYSVSGTTVTFVSNIYADAGTTAFYGNANSLTFSPDGTKLVLGGQFSGYAKIYSVTGTTVTYVSDIYVDTGTTALSGAAQMGSFSPDGTKLVLVGPFSGMAKIYSVSGTVVTFVSNIYADAGTTAITGMPYTVSFSPDGTTLILGGQFSGYAKIYSVSGTTVTFVSNIYADAGTTALSEGVLTLTFSPDGTKLVLGGGFSTGYAKMYSVSGTTVTFVSNIYADAGTTAFYGNVYASVFSPDGTRLVLSCLYLGFAKIYSVSGTVVTFVSNIYADAGTTALSGMPYTVSFSPDGTKLVLGGDFTGYAKIYSVSGTTVTFVSNIYADAGTTALSSTVNTATFSPDGTKLVLGGQFSGSAKIYSVSGTTVTFVSNIYADAGTTALSGTVYLVAFSPDGTKLILSGYYLGPVKIYSVSGTTVTYVMIAYKYSLMPYKLFKYLSLYNIDIGIAKENVSPESMARIEVLTKIH